MHQTRIGSWGSAPDPDGGACSTPPYLLAGQQGPPLPHLPPASLSQIHTNPASGSVCPTIHTCILSWLRHCMVESTYNMLSPPPTHNLATGLGLTIQKKQRKDPFDLLRPSSFPSVYSNRAINDCHPILATNL